MKDSNEMPFWKIQNLCLHQPFIKIYPLNYCTFIISKPYFISENIKDRVKWSGWTIITKIWSSKEHLYEIYWYFLAKHQHEINKELFNYYLCNRRHRHEQYTTCFKTKHLDWLFARRYNTRVLFLDTCSNPVNDFWLRDLQNSKNNIFVLISLKKDKHF